MYQIDMDNYMVNTNDLFRQYMIKDVHSFSKRKIRKEGRDISVLNYPKMQFLIYKSILDVYYTPSRNFSKIFSDNDINIFHIQASDNILRLQNLKPMN